MVRTNTKAKAKDLEKIYQDNTTLKLKRIDSTMSSKTIGSTIKLFEEKKLDGVICVDMLGEGFDFPNLKLRQYMNHINLLQVRYNLLVVLQELMVKK